MFTQTEYDRFALHGLIKCSGFLPPAQLARAREVIFQEFEREGIWKDGQWHLTRQEFIPGLAAGMALVKPLNRHPAIIDLAGGVTLTAASALAGGRAVYPMNPTQRCSAHIQTPVFGRCHTRVGIWICHDLPKAVFRACRSSPSSTMSSQKVARRWR